MAVSRVHETISVHTKGKGIINKVKVPYLEMKGHDIDGIVTDIKRLKTALNNTKSLDAVLAFLENNKISYEGKCYAGLTVSSDEINGVNRSLAVMNSIKNGLNEKSIIRSDRFECDTFTRHGINADKRKSGDRSCNALQGIFFGLNEKTIIKQGRDHYNTIHPTQKPVRLLERLLALVSGEGDLVLDPFSGSASAAIAAYNTGRRFIGFEIDREYYDSSVERLEKVLSTPRQGELFV
jgi:site-specific DNA-methyltransferase (adenine-specific)